ncbi:MAG: alpha/beta fold hydrolase, partial [Chloroflexota bacterium]
MFNPSNAFQGEEHQPFQFDGNNGRAVLLTHGFPGSAAEMRPVGALFHKRGWTSRGVLLPGFGPAIETLPEKSMDDWLDAVMRAYSDLRRTHDTVVVAGNSMGGALSIQAAAQ